ncbi:MAG: amidase [Pseudomonadota bacterium]
METSDHRSRQRRSSTEIRLWDQKIHAFVDPDLPNMATQDSPEGSLQTVTVGVKDIIDVAGIPTRNGSATCERAAAAEEDAAVVAALRAAGATLLGKTTTTEFAFTDPTDCRNPYDLNRSPGGSSSGSGAAVAAGILDAALGTQTAGSLCRPAAYCGAVGFKPSYGVLPMRGVTPLAPSFDTLGVITRSVDLSERMFQAIRSESSISPAKEAGACITCSLLLDTTTDVADNTMAAFHEAATVLGHSLSKTQAPGLPIDPARVVSDHRIVMNYEAFAAHGHLLAEETARLLKPKFKAGLEAGAGISATARQAALDRLAKAREVFWASMKEVDAILALPVPDGAPLIDGTTGFQDWLTPWTVFGGPLLCLPWGLDTFGRPKSVMLAGHPKEDATLLAVAKLLEAKAPDLPLPVLPA